MAEEQQVKTDDLNALTPGELKYLQSNGEDTSGLQIEETPPAPEPVPIPEPAPEPAPEPVKAEEAAPPPSEAEADESEIDPKSGKPKTIGRWVSKAALDSERAERKRLSEELSGKTEQWARLEERFRVFQEAMNEPEPAEPEAEPELPDPEQDIFGWAKSLPTALDRKLAQLEQKLNQYGEQVTQYGQQSEQQRQQQATLTAYRQDAARFSQEQADFMDAYRFLVGSRNAELEVAGYADPQERNRLIIADEEALVSRALQGRVSPAERMYALAKARGYKTDFPGSRTIAPIPEANGAAAAQPAAPAQVAPTATEQIAKLQEGSEKAMSLSNAGGNKPNNLTIQDLVAMSDQEFRKFARENPQLLEVMAGR